jgi:hypothetical protein
MTRLFVRVAVATGTPPVCPRHANAPGRRDNRTADFESIVARQRNVERKREKERRDLAETTLLLLLKIAGMQCSDRGGWIYGCLHMFEMKIPRRK